LKTEIIGIQGNRSGKDRTATHRKGADPAQLYSKIVERYAMFFDRPEVRLRFLNNTLAKQAERQAQLHHSLRRFRFLERTRFYDWVLEARFYSAILEEMRALAPYLPSNRRHLVEGIQAPLSARAFFLFHQARHAFYAFGVFTAGLLLFSLYSFVSWSARSVNSYLSHKYNRGRAPIVVTPAGQGSDNSFAATGAKYLPDYKPEKVWLVERDGEMERYSNGCRILTRYETENHLRAYYTIPRGKDTDGDQLRHDIVGIVYHTSESDIVPFIPENNNSIQRRTEGLINYILKNLKNKSYNYLVDRYGEIYRIVRDDHTAYHSGNSIWADEKYNYILLNESFIGICFESTVNAETLEETLTEAQIVAGRALTNVLRSKYSIDDANCTTHGIVSVNPDKMLIAYHHDWVRNFPFEAMGLSDKYKVPPPTMLDYGFTYDEDTLKKLGNRLWEGALAAEDEFKKRAEKARISPELLRRKLQDRYLAQRKKVHDLHSGQSDAGKPPLAAKSSVTSDSAESANN
jgi:hypothetical protein